ncbi:MAG: type I glyceraldehyde-3-phosphate dehydrogenase [Actinomycetes bacterium]|jgi:glyceraldehyde 3-phosphate dehydrogenase|nr:type I glyceraldehyde-3-phosphate dehydrogenase [Acidimicrobiia bacterium]
MVRVAINGFGRIGRCTFKQFLEDDRFEVVGINDLSDLDDLAYLLKYDSVHGWYPRKVSTDGSTLVVDGHKIPFSQERDPSRLPWADLGVDVVVEATGAMRSREDAAGHIEAGARKVVISAPSDDADATFVVGVNEDTYDPDNHHVVSNASCTTNCLAPVAKVLSDRFGIEHLMLSTIHAYTSSQSLMDLPTRKRRRGRAAALSIIPTTTGATKATEKVIPELAGKMTGMAYRVPVEDGSVSDITATLSREVTIEEVHEALAEAAEGRMKGVLRLTEEELVSRDIIGDPHSSIVDTPSTLLLNGNVIKLVAWYDNEWGYSARMVDISAIVAGEA